jgi:hypothetical protein
MTAKDVFSLVLWRDEVNEKKKARAIQRVIDKSFERLSYSEKGKLIHDLKLTGSRLSAW